MLRPLHNPIDTLLPKLSRTPPTPPGMEQAYLESFLKAPISFSKKWIRTLLGAVGKLCGIVYFYVGF
ncbi:hypothetical protein BDR04DRAFT_1109187 [Suillus decipiens]|nr:hypothetical protein BDR04DRAFT_1109187 [Suillus decipiens]